MTAQTITVSARIERSKKGKRVRVRCVDDGRYVQCCKGWRVGVVGTRARIQAVDAGPNWRMVGDKP